MNTPRFTLMKNRIINTVFRVQPWVLLLAIILLITSMTIIMVTHTDESKKITTVQTQLEQLNSIEHHVNTLITQTSQTPPATAAEVEVLSMKVNAIGSQLSALKASPNTAEVKAAISASTTTLSAELVSLKQLTTAIKTAVMPKAYLPVSALPFRVVGIDLWNGELKATLRDADELAPPMGLQDSKAGWTLIQISADPSQAIFQNSKGQKVLVRVGA